MNASAQEPLRIGVLGPGWIADRRLLPALGKINGAYLWSVCGRDFDRTSDFARKHRARGRRPVQTKIARFLEDPELDAVLIATPDRLHFEQAMLALEHHKHVLVEKPLIDDPQQADLLIDAAKRAGKVLHAGYQLRHHRGHQAIFEHLQAQALGPLYQLRFHWTHPSSQDHRLWRKSATGANWGAMAALGTHCIDLAQYFLGLRSHAIVDVSKQVRRDLLDGPLDDEVFVRWLLEDRCQIELSLSFRYASPSRIEIFGQNGAIIAEDTLGGEGRGSIHWHERGPILYNRVDPYEAQIRAFFQDIQRGQDLEPLRERLRENAMLMWSVCPPIHIQHPPSTPSSPEAND